MSKDLKASLLQNYHKIARLHLITEHPLTKNKPRKKLSKTTLDMKTQNHFVEKKGCTPLLAKNMFSCSAKTPRGKRYAKTSSQMPMYKTTELIYKINVT